MQCDNLVPMKRKKFEDYLTTSFMVVLIGLIIVIVGVYFQMNSLTSSGYTMGRFGRQYGTGTIDGRGMIFCGLIVTVFGLICRDKKTSGGEAE